LTSWADFRGGDHLHALAKAYGPKADGVRDQAVFSAKVEESLNTSCLWDEVGDSLSKADKKIDN